MRFRKLNSDHKLFTPLLAEKPCSTFNHQLLIFQDFRLVMAAKRGCWSYGATAFTRADSLKYSSESDFTAEYLESNFTDHSG